MNIYETAYHQAFIKSFLPRQFGSFLWCACDGRCFQYLMNEFNWSIKGLIEEWNFLVVKTGGLEIYDIVKRMMRRNLLI